VTVNGLIPVSSVTVRPFHPAPVRDPRSRPLEAILHQSAGEFFGSARTGCGPSSDAPHTSDWRLDMTRLYADNGYQFSSSYKPAARARSSVTGDSWSTSTRFTRTRNSSVPDGTQRSGRKTSAACGSVAASADRRTTSVGDAACKKTSSTSVSSSSRSRTTKSIRHTMTSISAALALRAAPLRQHRREP